MIFGFGKILGYLTGAGIILVAGWFLWNEYNDRLEQIGALENQVQQTQDALQTTRESFGRLQEDFDRNVQLTRELQRQMQEAEQQVDDLQDIFNDHDLEELARERPGLIEGIINDGTREALDNLECITDPECVQPNDN